MQLLERDHVLAELSALGPGTAVAILGEAGVGKTTVLREFARRTRGRVLIAGCEALFTPRPLGPLYDLADDLGVDPDLSRERLFPSVLSALRREPTLLIVEDVHWADRATLDLLKYLTRRVGETDVRIAVSYRDDEISADHPLTTLLAERLARLRLEPLSRQAVERLGGTGAMHDITGGNPFYVTELLAAKSEGVPPTVRDAVRARAMSLTRGARSVIEMASLIPGRAELSLLDATRDDIEEAAHSGIVRLENEALVFRHELGRLAIESTLSDIRRVPMHQSILAKLKGSRSLARLAHHAAGARDAEAILHYAPLAADEAVKAGAHREAAAHYRSALAWSGPLPPRERANLLESLAYECYLTDQLQEALESRIAAREIHRQLGDTLQQGDNLRWQSRLLWFLGRNDEAWARASEAIATLESVPEGSELAMAYSNQSQLCMLAQKNEDAIRWGTMAIGLARRLGDDVILAHALNNVGVAESWTTGSLEKIEESLRISLDHGYAEHIARAYTNLGSALVRFADYTSGQRYLDEGIAWCRDRDLDSWVLYMSAWRANLHLEVGEWDDALRTARSVLESVNVSAISRIPALVVAGRVLARRGDPASAALLDIALSLAARTREFQRLAPVAVARAEAAWLHGDSAAAASEVAESFSRDESKDEIWIRGELAIFLWRGGAISEVPERIAEPFGLQIAGRWREASEAFAAASRPYEAALALADSDEPAAIQSAIEGLEALGDRVLGERLRQKLRRLGVRGPRLSTRANPSGLTAREIEIVELLDRGLRNAEIADKLFVSAKTVDHHVSSILGKLGAKTRGEAARIYRSQK